MRKETKTMDDFLCTEQIDDYASRYEEMIELLSSSGE